MCPSIAISEKTMDDLKTLAVPFEDHAPADVVRRLIEAEISRQAEDTSEPTARHRGVPRKLDPLNPESLTHTRIIEATVAGNRVRKPRWNGLLRKLHVIGLEQLGSFEELRKLTTANIRQGEQTEHGFRYMPEAGFSIQSVEANVAWERTISLAQHLGVPISVTFEWRNKSGATHPGDRGELDWQPG